MKQIVINIEESQLEYIDKIASRFNHSRNSTIREALNIYIAMYMQSLQPSTDKEDKSAMDKNLDK